MIGTFKAKIGAWLVARFVSQQLARDQVEAATRTRVHNSISKAVQNMIRGKQTIKNEPVAVGAIVTIACAIFSAYQLDVSQEELAITISTVVAIVSWVQRRLVSPVRKD